jgi:hypothetical protein
VAVAVVASHNALQGGFGQSLDMASLVCAGRVGGSDGAKR